jgi:hypothetical protein
MGTMPVPDQDLQDRADRAVAQALERRLAELRPKRIATPNVGLALGSVALGIPVTAVAGSDFHGPAAVVAVCVGWAAIAAINVAHPLRDLLLGRQATVAPSAPLPAARLPTPAAALPAEPLARLPLDVRIKVEQVRTKAEMLLQHQDRFPLGSRNLYVLSQIRSAYLPSTLDAYLALDGDDRPVTTDGRTALQVLRDQLTLLDGKLDEIADDLQRENADRLVANLRFLEQHFGAPGASELRL